MGDVERRSDMRLAWKGGTMLSALLLFGCQSTAPPEVTPQTEADTAWEEPTTTQAESRLEVQSVELNATADGEEVEVMTAGPLVWTSYRDSDNSLVVELPNGVPVVDEDELLVEPANGLVESVELETEGNGVRPVTRIVVATREESEHAVIAEGNLLRIQLSPLAEGLGGGEPPAPYEAESLTPPILASSPALAAGTPDNPQLGPPPSGVPATQLQGIDTSTADGATRVHVRGDGEFYYSTFNLENPARFVIDLIGVVNTASQTTYEVATEPVERIRVAQFKPRPELVARVVVDLQQPSIPTIDSASDGLSLHFGADAMVDTTLVADVENGFTNDVAPVGDYATDTTMDAGVDEAVDTVASAPHATEWTPVGVPVAEPTAMPEPVMPAPAMPAPMPEPIQESMQMAQVEETQVDPGTTWSETSWNDAPAPVAEPTPGGNILYTDPPPASESSNQFVSQTVGESEKKYEGELIDLTLKDADIKDVLRSFAQLSGLNVVVQPGVSGTVTAELVQVPWDQALEQILKINGLDFQLEGNIMRIAPIAQLRAEAQEQQKLLEAQSLSIPLRTVIKRISYASANEVASLLRSGGGASLLSQRGSVVVDNRTNTLIIKELPNFIDTVIAVIENLDTPEPQVMIEARIVETTKRFSRSLGIDWSFSGIASAATGNTTGLVFPNNGAIDGGVALPTGGRNAFLDVALGNVLNTFRLNAALQVAESEGLINIISAPKIATLNNENASIQSGLQIPVQTSSNNTVSVQFVNATLQLDVTPHVTAEGTVLMDINIQKREPQFAFQVGAANTPPIATREAQTRVIVRDGGTTVIGGIYEVSSDGGVDRVPGLSNVPILKHLFKNRRQSDENDELLIFITPRVIKL